MAKLIIKLGRMVAPGIYLDMDDWRGLAARLPETWLVNGVQGKVVQSSFQMDGIVIHLEVPDEDLLMLYGQPLKLGAKRAVGRPRKGEAET